MILIPLSLVSQVQTVVLQPGPGDGYDSEVRSDEPNQNLGDWFDFIANAWTAQGNFFIQRSFIRFDLANIPADAIIINATLDLYTNLNTGHYQLDSGPNTAYFMRILEDWLEHEVTWNNQPSSSWQDLVILPQSTSHTQTYHVDLTDHVQDMVLHPETNYGWMFRLEIEDTYRCMVFASSDHQNVSWRPRLTITYTDCLPPTADFSYDAQQYTVYFTDQSSPVLSWNWDFGDGESSVQQNPVHTYQNPGTYIVKLTVQDSCSSATHSDTLQIQCTPPLAGFYFTYNYPEVNFFDATIPPDIYSWYWDFGDESHSSQQNPVHIYDYSGNYNVCLYVIDTCSSDSICQEVAFFPPMYHNFGFDPSATNDLEVSFKDKTSGATKWLWDFGDGARSTLQNPVHVYTNYGKYWICMTGTYGTSEKTSCDSLDLKEKIIDPVYKTTFYPNPPANNKITINFAKDAEYSDIKLFDLTGKIIWFERISPAYKQQPVEIDLPDLRPGLCFIRIDLDGKQVVDKLNIP